MNRFFATGILVAIIVHTHAQEWRFYHDSLPPTLELQWQRSILGLLKVARTQQAASVAAHVSYLAGVYTGNTLNATDSQDRFLDFVTSFAMWQAAKGQHVLLRELAIDEFIPFKPENRITIIDAITRHYTTAGSPDSSRHIINLVTSRKNGVHTRSIGWYTYLADLNTRAGNPEKALQLLRHAERHPILTGREKNARTNLALAMAGIYLRMGDYEHAEKMLRDNIRKLATPGNQDEELRQKAHLLLAETYEKQNLPDRALAVVEQYLVSVPNVAANMTNLPTLDMLNKRAGILMAGGNHAAAAEEFENLVSLYPIHIPESHPVFIKLLNNLGQAYLTMHQQHRAYIYFRWAYEMMQQPDTFPSMVGVEVLTNLAEVYSRKGDNSSAERHLQEAELLRNTVQ